MSKTRLALNLLAVFVLGLACSSLVSAQATRTWVSGTGSDANPCSRTAPCQTFSGAFSKTAINGEIDALDPHGFGTLTVSKSITIDGSGTFASVLASGTTGFTINLTSAVASDPLRTVRLRGISINGTGSCGAGCGSRSGIRGINVSTANTTQPKVVLEDIVIDGFVNEGILFAANGGDLTLSNVSIRNNGTAGLRADSFGANTVFVSVNNSSSNINAQEGFRFEDNVRGTITYSTANNNTLNGYVVIATTASQMNVDHSTAANNRQNGVFSVNANSTIRVTNSEITNNVVNGFAISGGQLCTNTKNRVTTPTQAANCNFNDQ
jgi:hypothetical protein